MGDMADDIIDRAFEYELWLEEGINQQEYFDMNAWPDGGDGIPLGKMGMSHISNAIKWIKRNGKESMDGYGFLWLPKLEKELASRMPFEDMTIPF